jgi:hypothetical protein
MKDWVWWWQCSVAKLCATHLHVRFQTFAVPKHKYSFRMHLEQIWTWRTCFHLQINWVGTIYGPMARSRFQNSRICTGVRTINVLFTQFFGRIHIYTRARSRILHDWIWIGTIYGPMVRSRFQNSRIWTGVNVPYTYWIGFELGPFLVSNVRDPIFYMTRMRSRVVHIHALPKIFVTTALLAFLPGCQRRSGKRSCRVSAQTCRDRERSRERLWSPTWPHSFKFGTIRGKHGLWKFVLRTRSMSRAQGRGLQSLEKIWDRLWSQTRAPARFGTAYGSEFRIFGLVYGSKSSFGTVNGSIFH